MFTPPPSPLPPPRILITDESDSHSTSEKSDLSGTSLLVPSSSRHPLGSCKREESRMQEAQMDVAEAIIKSYERKRRTARRTRWAVLLVPAVLILVAFTSRRVTSLGIMDELESALGLDVTGMRVGDELLSGLGSGSEGETGQSRGNQIFHHKRQALSLSNPAAPSATDLITTSAPANDANNEEPASETDSPTPTVPPQTEQTIPPVPEPSDPPTIPTPFPQPFDTTGPTSNLTTQTCFNFFLNMTQEAAFRSCRPFSLLEYFSGEFIQAQTNLTLLNTLIYGTCNTNTPLDTCISNMDWFASRLESDCATELRQNNQRVRQTLRGLESYSLLRTSACLVNQLSNTYCYAAAAHASSPADIFLYQLPLGIGFPVATTQPSCSSPCSRSLLGLYADAVRSGNKSTDGLRETYEDSARLAVEVCGNGFAAVGVVPNGAEGIGLRWRGWEGLGSVGIGVVVSVGIGMWL